MGYRNPHGNGRAMDCREFRNKHAIYVDLMCSALEENEMREHTRRCPKCSRHDTLVRRSLILVKSLPDIEPSSDFRARLEARLHSSPVVLDSGSRRWSTSLAYAAMAAGIAFVGYLAVDTMTAPASPIRLAPVVATLPDLEPSQMATHAFVATVPTGMSIWPAIMMASQAPMHFVATELASER
jgi:hypothetical protein